MTTDILEIGRAAAIEAAGADAVGEVELKDTVDRLYRPAYLFTFEIERSRFKTDIGKIYVHIFQRLRDELIALNDEHMPIVRLLSPDDWPKRSLGRPV